MSSDDSPYRVLPALAPTVLATARILTEASRAALSISRRDDASSDPVRPALPLPATAA